MFFFFFLSIWNQIMLSEENWVRRKLRAVALYSWKTPSKVFNGLNFHLSPFFATLLFSHQFIRPRSSGIFVNIYILNFICCPVGPVTSSDVLSEVDNFDYAIWRLKNLRQKIYKLRYCENFDSQQPPTILKKHILLFFCFNRYLTVECGKILGNSFVYMDTKWK